MEYEIKLATKPGVPNINGRVYTKEAYDNAIEKANYKIEHGVLFLLTNIERSMPGNYYYSDIIGTVKKINEDSILVEPYDFGEIILNSINLDDYVAGMNYCTDSITKQDDGTYLVGDVKLSSYSLLNKHQMITYKDYIERKQEEQKQNRRETNG